MAEHLFALQTESGHEVVSAVLDVDKVGDVYVHVDGDSIVLGHNGEGVTDPTTAPEGKLFLHRWPANDKLAKPVTYEVPR